MTVKFFDFAKNSYQYSVSFKFDCLDLMSIKNLTQHLLVDKKRFSVVSKDSQDKAALSGGEGTEKAPLFQLRLREDSFVLGVGWFVGYQKWREWRDLLIMDSLPVLNAIPVSFVSQLSGQSSIAIPPEKIKDPTKLEWMAPMRKLLGAMVPEEMTVRGNLFTTLSDATAANVVDIWSAPLGQGAGEEAISFAYRRTALDEKLSLEQVIHEHCHRSDELLERFHNNFLALIVND
jgi:hypothetical protein